MSRPVPPACRPLPTVAVLPLLSVLPLLALGPRPPRPPRRLRAPRRGRRAGRRPGTGRRPARLLPPAGPSRRHDRLRLRRGPLEGLDAGRGGVAADHRRRGRGLPRDLARRHHRGLRRPLRRPGGGLHDAARGRDAGSPHLAGLLRPRHADRLGLDQRRAGDLRDERALDAAVRPARGARPGDRRLARGPAGRGLRRRVERGGHGALLRAPSLPGEPHQALPRRDRPADLALGRGRRRSGPADRRLPRHQPQSDGLERPRLLPFRPRRHDEPVVDDRRREGPAPAHGTPVGHRRGLARRGADRLPLRRGPVPLRPRDGDGDAARDHAGLGPRPDPRAYGQGPAELDHLRPPRTRRHARRAHRARAGLRRAGRARPVRRGLAPARRALPRRALPARREGAALALGRVGGDRALDAAGQRRRRRPPGHPGRRGAALARDPLPRRRAGRAHRQEPAAVADRAGHGRHPQAGRERDRRRRGACLVARRPLAGRCGARRQPQPARPALRGRGRRADGGRRPGRRAVRDDRSLRQLEPRLLGRREVARLPVRAAPRVARPRAVGPDAARAVLRQDDADLPAAADSRACARRSSLRTSCTRRTRRRTRAPRTRRRRTAPPRTARRRRTAPRTKPARRLRRRRRSPPRASRPGWSRSRFRPATTAACSSPRSRSSGSRPPPESAARPTSRRSRSPARSRRSRRCWPA